MLAVLFPQYFIYRNNKVGEKSLSRLRCFLLAACTIVEM